MLRGLLLYLSLILVACGANNPAATSPEQAGLTDTTLAGQFKALLPPFTLSDSALLATPDTTQKGLQAILQLPDSLLLQAFNTTRGVKLVPLGRFTGKKKELYLLVMAVQQNKKAAFIAVAPTAGTPGPALPFLIPDKDPTTRQVSTLAESFGVIRTTQRIQPDEAVLEGKDVFAYSEMGNSFDLVMTDPLNEAVPELINPIDTLGRTYVHAGDYQRNKRNIVSVRDGRKQGLITLFIHMEQREGTCTGEIKGDAQIVDAQTALYRTPGDPCVLTLKFGRNTVTLEEQEGCGSRRGLECSFNGTFTKAKAAKTKTLKRK